jgi:Bacterial PH domain
MQASFRSKVDRKLQVIGLIAPIVALIAIGTTARGGRELLLLPALLTALAAALTVWIVLSTYYEFTRDLLVAHCGPFSWRIPLESISSVRESRSVRSGPALSMDRLEITWGEGCVLLISPADKPGFLAALHARAPHTMSPAAARRSAPG